MTGAVGAKRGIIGATRVAGGVAVTTGLVEHLVVHGDPVGVEMGLWLRAARDFNISHKFRGSGNDGDGVAKVAFQADGLLRSIHMLAIMAAETAGEIHMTDVVGMGIPV